MPHEKVMQQSDGPPKVSVLVPTYNRAHLLDRCLNSILFQTYQNFEIIVVDDGSTDNTKEIINRFKDQSIRYFRHKQNRGEGAARNTGLKEARGDYIAFLDSDDEWLPEKLEKQMKIFERLSEKVGIVYTDSWKINGNLKQYWHPPHIMPEDKIVYNQALERVRIQIGTVVIKRECFDKAGMFDERFVRLVDREFFIRVSAYYYFYHIEEPLLNYYRTEDALTSDRTTLVSSYELLLKKHPYKLIGNNRILSKDLYEIGKMLFQDGKLKQGRGYLIKAVKLYPFNMKRMFVLFISLFGERVYSMLLNLKRSAKRLFVFRNDYFLR